MRCEGNENETNACTSCAWRNARRCAVARARRGVQRRERSDRPRPGAGRQRPPPRRRRSAAPPRHPRAAAAAAPAAAPAEPAAAAPTPNKGDNAWMIVATRARDHDVDPGPRAVLRRARPLEEHAVGADAGVRHLLAHRRAVGDLRLQHRVHRGRRVLRRLRPAVPVRNLHASRTAWARSRRPPRSARAW